MHEHVSDTELALFAMNPDSVPLERRQRSSGRRPSVRSAARRSSFFSVVSTEELGDVELWEPEATWRSDDDPMRARRCRCWQVAR